LARQFGLVAERTGLVSQFEIASTDLGRSWVFVGGGPQDMARRSVTDTAFESRVLYSPEISVAYDAAYLFWKTEDVADRVPGLDDPGVADEVRRAWKTVQARQLAREEAKKLRDEAAKAGRPLKEVLTDRPEYRRITPPPFTWLTLANVPAELPTGEPPQLRPGQVEGVEMAGLEFMQAVFSLGPGQLDVALNQPQTAAYVVRMVELSPPDAQLLKQFEEEEHEGLGRYARVAFGEQQQIDQAWKKEIETTVGFKWEKKPAERVTADYEE
jgi:hypothetical protein